MRNETVAVEGPRDDLESLTRTEARHEDISMPYCHPIVSQLTYNVFGPRNAVESASFQCRALARSQVVSR